MTEMKTEVEAYVMQGRGKDSGWGRLAAELRFSSDDPIAATLHIGGDHDEAVDWTFAFDLIAQIMSNPTAGIGDVRFSYDVLMTDFVLLRLASESGAALLRLKTADIKTYMQSVRSMLNVRPEVDIVAEALDRTISGILESSA